MHLLKADGELGADGPKGPEREGGGVMMLQQRRHQASQLLPCLLLLYHTLLLEPGQSSTCSLL